MQKTNAWCSGLLIFPAIYLAGSCLRSQAQPVGKIKLKANRTVPDLNIGRRSSLAEGNAASLRALARLLRRYPHMQGYNVHWSVKVKPGPVNFVVTMYFPLEASIRRAARPVGGAGRTINNLQYDGITREEIIRAGRHGGSFHYIERYAAHYSQGQQYWK